MIRLKMWRIEPTECANGPDLSYAIWRKVNDDFQG